MAELKVWAPKATRLEVELRGEREVMQPMAGSWWCFTSDELRHDTDYALWIDGEGPQPDPRSAFQPYGVHGASRCVDHSRFEWHDAEWQATPLESAIFYELHIGTFTNGATFTSAIEALDELKELGITHVQIMPVAEFGGERGWGYDGVNLYAPHHAYGGPDGFKRFVDACHARGLAVILDVVYNHLGPGGNYISCFGPYFTDIFKTPWGQAVNLDGPWSHEVRAYFIDNALMWLRDYHVDGLRVDAVHALIDRSAIHFLEQLADEVEVLGETLDRHYILVAESDLNDPRYIRPIEQGGYGMDAQFNEDFHHALHALLTGENFGYYVDFGKLSDLAQTLQAGYCYDNRYSTFRKRHHGRPARGLNGSQFIASIQNHDQIGNRGLGERMSHLVDGPRLKLGAALTILSPFVPLIFQGEEWAASTPFLYFVDFNDPELAEAIRKGRREEFGTHGWNPDNLPDPLDEATWRRCQLKREERVNEPHNDMLRWYQNLIALRSSEPDFHAGPLDPEAIRFDTDAGWLRIVRGRFIVLCNFSAKLQRIACETAAPPRLRLCSIPGARVDSDRFVELPPWAVAVLYAGDHVIPKT